MNPDAIETGARVFLDSVNVFFRIGTAHNFFRHVLLSNHFCGLFEVRGHAKLRGQLAFDGDVRPVTVGRAFRFLFVFRPADGQLGIGRLTVAAGVLEFLEKLFFWSSRNKSVCNTARKLGVLRTRSGDENRRQLFRQCIDACVLNGEVFAVMTLLTAAPQQPDHIDRFAQHFEPDVGRRPSVSRDVLVQILARTHAKHESSGHNRRHSCCRLRNDHRMNSKGRARDTGADSKTLCGMGYCANDAPHKRTLTLLLSPRMEMVRDHRKGEAGFLSALRIANQLVRCVFLATEFVSDFESHFFPPFLPPFLLDLWLSFLPRPLPDFLLPPDSLLTVAQARLFASFFETPLSSYPSSMCSALRFCLSVYFPLSPCGIDYSPLV